MLGARCDGAGIAPPARARAVRRTPAARTSCLTTCATAPTARAETSARRRAAESSRPARPARAGSDCASGFCAQGVCCQTACTATCMSCALAGTAGTCTMVAAGGDPLGQCADQGAADLRHRRDLRRRRRLPAVRERHDLRRGGAARNRRTRRRRRATARAPARADAPSPAAPTACGTNDVPAACAADADCVGAQRLHRRAVRQEGAGHRLRERRRMRLRAVPAGRLLQPSCTGTCRSCALAGSPRHLRAVPAGADPLTSDRQRRHQLRHRRDRATAPAAAACMRRARVRGGDVHRRRRSHPRASCNGTGSCQAGTPNILRSVRCAERRRLPHDLHRQRRLQRAQHLHQRQLRQETDRARPARRPASAIRASANRGSAARPRAPGPAGRAPWPARSEPARRFRRRQIPLNQCTDQGTAGCGQDGTCNGSGACRLYATGTTCVASSAPAPPSRPPAPATGRAPARR